MCLILVKDETLSNVLPILISSLLYVYCRTHQKLPKNIFKKKSCGLQPLVAHTCPQLNSAPPFLQCFHGILCCFLSPGYHLLMLRLNPRNNEVVLKTCCQYESIRIFVFAFSTSCVKLFPSLFLQLKRRPDFGQGWLGGWWAPFTSWSIWFLRKSQAGSTRLDSGRWSPQSAQHATCSNNTYRLVHM